MIRAFCAWIVCQPYLCGHVTEVQAQEPPNLKMESASAATLAAEVISNAGISFTSRLKETMRW